MTERAECRESLRPAIACILRDRAAAIPWMDPGPEWEALFDGADTLGWVDEREAVELADWREERMVALQAEVDQRDEEIDTLKRQLAAATKRGTRAATELAKLKAMPA